MKRWVALLFTSLTTLGAEAGEMTLAAASNFLTTAEALVAEFEADTGHEVTLTHGSTGQLYAQIVLGAPFDVFFAADSERPQLLVEDNRAAAAKPYALGRLVLVSTAPVTVDDAQAALEGRTVALADPTVAPYGKAATRAMEALDLDTAGFRPVLVANVGQVASVFATGNAEAAFVAASQVPRLEAAHVLPLADLIPDVVQEAALLNAGAENPAATAFWEWLDGPTARAIVVTAGYGLPEG
ncbi:MAG: molybdate ABC transporter substrate-binding protein [Silicimonas sp.]|nr:molybdate ABC transporter substrate-binding protein [Silicimonas sp.]